MSFIANNIAIYVYTTAHTNVNKVRYQSIEKLFLLYTRLYVMYAHVTELRACKSSPCLNDGRCYDTSKGFLCICSGNFEGSTCSGRC